MTDKAGGRERPADTRLGSVDFTPRAMNQLAKVLVPRASAHACGQVPSMHGREGACRGEGGTGAGRCGGQTMGLGDTEARETHGGRVGRGWGRGVTVAT